MATPFQEGPRGSATDKRDRLRQILSARAERSQLHPLSQGQRALWFLHRLAPQSPAYNVMYAARVKSPLDVPAFGRAVEAVVARHSILATTYHAAHGVPGQRIEAKPKVDFAVSDGAAMDEHDLERRLMEEADLPFDLERGPVFRVRLFTRAADEHVLLLAIHHIAVDFWSLALIVDELGVLYLAERAGGTDAAPRPRLQYLDYVRWQKAMLASPEGESLWAYWQRQLGGELPILQLPSDRPRPPVQTYHGQKLDFPLSLELAERLRSLAREESATAYMIFLAAFDTLLFRYTGQSDILVGSPMLGRGRPELESIVGYISNPVVLRERVSGELSFRQLLSNVRKTVLNALDHQDFPFPLLVERLQPVRDPSYSPLFQVLFMWDKQRTAGPICNVDGLALFPLASEQRGAPFDLSLTVFEIGQAFSVRFQYNIDIFDQWTIDRLGQNFLALLEHVVSVPGVRLATAQVVAAGERRQLLEHWNDTQASCPDGCVHELLEAQARLTPDAVALVFENRSLTYRELHLSANRLGRDLCELGVGPDVLVGVCIERSVEMVVAILAVLKAGGAYVPLDPTYPKERLALMLDDARPAVLLTQTHLLERLPSCPGHVLCLKEGLSESAGDSGESSAGRSRPDNLAYVIYTSGSTGKPKGVEIPHRAVVNLLTSMLRAPGLTSHDVFLAVTSLSFDIAALEIWLPLLAGARVVIVSRSIAADGKLLLDRMIESGATVAQATPATWQLMLNAGWPAEVPLQKALCGGDVLPRDLAARLKQRCGRLFHLYGPTETTIWSSMEEIESAGDPVTIGRPIANTRMCVLDSEMQPVPIGVPGELYIGGAGLARGYHGRPDLTAERFVTDPFAAGRHLYRTGDLARFLSDGRIEFLGRIDRQVKISGHRIELGEIEAALRRHPGVADVSVLARTDAAGSRLLTAYVVGRDGLTLHELRQFLRDLLPQYMIPAAFVFLDALPLTPNRKVDYNSLPAPGVARPKLEQQFVPARNPVEEMLAAICAQVLNLQTVGIHDNFFELGGTSLRAVEIVSKANESGLPLVPEMLFEHQTVAELAEALAGFGPPAA